MKIGCFVSFLGMGVESEESLQLQVCYRVVREIGELNLEDWRER